jgi:DNA adenine methylase
VNEQFLEWSRQHNSFDIKSNYISYHDNTNKEFKEVLVTNFEPQRTDPQQKMIFSELETVEQ